MNIGGFRLLISGLLLGLIFPVSAQELTADPNRVPELVEGVWQTEELSEVTISLCPEGFCGVLSKIIVPREGLTEEEYAIAMSMAPETFTDVRNPDPLLRSRLMLGLQILTLRPSVKRNIHDGDIYNPQDGNVYSGYVELTGQNSMRLNGCVLYNIICQGQDWVRVLPEPVATP